MTYEQQLAALSAVYPKAPPVLIELAARGAAAADAPLAIALPEAERHRLVDEIVDRVVAVLERRVQI